MNNYIVFVLAITLMFAVIRQLR